MIHTKISAQLRLTVRQVEYTLSLPYLEPKKAPGRAPTLSSEDVDQIEIFITSSSQGRRMSWSELAAGPFRYLGVSETVLHNELKKRGYARHPALKKPPLSEVNKRKRFEWAEAHKDWSDEDWMNCMTSYLTSSHQRVTWLEIKVIGTPVKMSQSISQDGTVLYFVIVIVIGFDISVFDSSCCFCWFRYFLVFKATEYGNVRI
ncbi:hypothetical protein K3495_g10977 [Podosphaera aphanis]|nr:hypothetical protein K3495_g10977 [Podosphaera aphanis]